MCNEYPHWLAYEPRLIPPPALMAGEGIDVLEDWFRWGEEWAVLLRVLTGYRPASIEELALQAGFRLHGPARPGYWSGAEHYTGAQGLVVLGR